MVKSELPTTAQGPGAIVRVLVVEGDASLADRIAEAMRAGITDGFRSRSDARLIIIDSLRALHRHSLGELDAVICAVDLPDGTGLDALAYIRGVRADLAVILTADPTDAEMATEAIRAGSSDFVLVTDDALSTLPVAVEKSIAHQLIQSDNERLQRDLQSSLADLELKNRQFEEVIEQLERKARTDDLTGLANRRWLNLMLEGAWAESERHHVPLALLMIDLDGFKRFNDELGHQIGDEVLRLAGEVISGSCRRVDTAARYGGDEFCVLLPHTGPEEASIVARRIHAAFVAAMEREQTGRPPVTMTVGVAHTTLSRPRVVEQLVAHADAALYEGKSRGRNRVIVRNADGMSEPEPLPAAT